MERWLLENNQAIEEVLLSVPSHYQVPPLVEHEEQRNVPASPQILRHMRNLKRRREHRQELRDIRADKRVRRL